MHCYARMHECMHIHRRVLSACLHVPMFPCVPCMPCSLTTAVLLCSGTASIAPMCAHPHTSHSGQQVRPCMHKHTSQDTCTLRRTHAAALRPISNHYSLTLHNSQFQYSPPQQLGWVFRAPSLLLSPPIQLLCHALRMLNLPMLTMHIMMWPSAPSSKP